MKITMSDDIKSDKDLRQAIKDALTYDECAEVVDMAFSETGAFENEVFLDSEAFFDTMANTEPFEIARSFYFGEDMDEGGPANPARDYFRYNGDDNVESTDNPGSIYSDEIEDDIVDFIMDHLDMSYPEYIQDAIDEYNENNKGEN